jgi:chromosome segregation ATPase
MKVKRLKRLRIRRVDLVHRGSNPAADVVLFKSAAMPGDMKVCKECGRRMKADEKVCAGCGAEMKETASKAAREEQMAENVEQIKKLQDDLKAATDLAEEEAKKREAVEKSLKEHGETIAALKTAQEEAKAEIKKAQDAAKLAEVKKTVDTFEHLPVKADVFAPVLKACAEALDEAGYKELMRVLKAADAAGAGNFAEIGAPGNGSGERSAAEEVNAKAEEMVSKSAGKLNMPDAIAQVMAQNPKLAARMRRESYSARAES